VAISTFKNLASNFNPADYFKSGKEENRVKAKNDLVEALELILQKLKDDEGNAQSDSEDK
jgi:hypothetical protein